MTGTMNPLRCSSKKTWSEGSQFQNPSCFEGIDDTVDDTVDDPIT